MKVPLFEAQKEWVEPEEFPDLRSYDEIAVDLETRDPDLKKKGSGSVIGNGDVVGIAVAVPGRSFYFPIAHGSGPNMDRKKVLSWFADTMASPSLKVFHNAMYDVCWIKKLGIKINGLIVDTMIAASLVDENRFRYSAVIKRLYKSSRSLVSCNEWFLCKLLASLVCCSPAVIVKTLLFFQLKDLRK